MDFNDQFTRREGVKGRGRGTRGRGRGRGTRGRGRGTRGTRGRGRGTRGRGRGANSASQGANSGPQRYLQRNLVPSRNLGGIRRTRGTLENCGSTCYINSAIQLLYSNEVLREHILSIDRRENLYILALKEIFNRLERDERSIDEPSIDLQKIPIGGRRIIDILIGLIEGAKLGEQQDVDEFFRKFVDKLNLPEDIKENMGLRERTYYICPNGEKVNVRIDILDYISLPVVEKTRVQNLLDLYQEPECLTEGNYIMGNEGKCGEGKNIKIKGLSLLPYEETEYISISLKRFKFNDDFTRRIKIKTEVELDDIITIDGKNFELQGYIIHTGETSNSGHYIYVDYVNEYVYDDATRREFSDEDQTYAKQNAYYLLYKKIDGENAEPRRNDAARSVAEAAQKRVEAAQKRVEAAQKRVEAARFARNAEIALKLKQEEESLALAQKLKNKDQRAEAEQIASNAEMAQIASNAEKARQLQNEEDQRAAQQREEQIARNAEMAQIASNAEKARQLQNEEDQRAAQQREEQIALGLSNEIELPKLGGGGSRYNKKSRKNKSRKVNNKSRKVNNKSRKVNNKSRKVNNKSRKVNNKSRKLKRPSKK